MSTISIYHLREPSVWSEGPDLFSFSSLSSIDLCSLQWQLMHSAYGDLSSFPVRPHPSAVEGDIVHQILDKLFKEMSFAGLPELASPEFSDVVAKVNVRTKVEQLVLDHKKRISAHPRSGGFRLRSGAQELVNRVVRLFRSEYPKATASQVHASTPQPMDLSSIHERVPLLPLLRERGALSEVRLQHPALPFIGILDLVRTANDKVTIVDFKTGAQKDAHKQQLLYYAVLWWRNTSEPPHGIEVRYPGAANATSVDEQLLANAEAQLTHRIDELSSQLNSPPAPARIGDHCQYCDVRQFCPTYWHSFSKNLFTAMRKAKTVDIELVIESNPASNGFLARSSSGVQCSVVYSLDGSKVHGPFELGEKLRILNAHISQDDNAIELVPWTEVFHV